MTRDTALVLFARRLLHARWSTQQRLQPTAPVPAEEFLDLLCRAGLRSDSCQQLIRSFGRRGQWTRSELASINIALGELETLLGSPIGTIDDASLSLQAVLRFANSQLKSGC